MIIVEILCTVSFAVFCFSEVLVTEYKVHRNSTKKSKVSTVCAYEVLESKYMEDVCLNMIPKKQYRH